jgi:hypothetical protein
MKNVNYPLNIELYKVKTLEEATTPQELKYPSDKVIAKGLMWMHTLPKIGEPFFVMENKLSPIFHTSAVKKLTYFDDYIEVITINSKYHIKWGILSNENKI